MDDRTTEGELLVNKEHQKKTDVPVILKTRKNAVPSWLQGLVSFSNPNSIKLYSFPRSFSEKSHTRDRGRKIPLTQRHFYYLYYNVTISSRLIHKREFRRTTLSKPNLLTQPYLLIVITRKLTTDVNLGN